MICLTPLRLLARLAWAGRSLTVSAAGSAGSAESAESASAAGAGGAAVSAARAASAFGGGSYDDDCSRPASDGTVDQKAGADVGKGGASAGAGSDGTGANADADSGVLRGVARTIRVPEVDAYLKQQGPGDNVVGTLEELLCEVTLHDIA
jgi:hypothetical protein